MKLGAVQQIILIALAPLIALGTGIGFAMSRSDAPPAATTVVFHGVATAASSGGLPISIDPTDVVVREEDGAIGLAYEYAATGQASDGMTGSFSYLERGRIYVSDPADPNSMVGSELYEASFTIFPSGGSSSGTVITDQCTECYQSGHETAGLSEVPSWARALVSRIAASQGSQGPEAVANYGFFKFSTDQGQFKGYATPDFGEFVIQLTFSEPSQS